MVGLLSSHPDRCPAPIKSGITAPGSRGRSHGGLGSRTEPLRAPGLGFNGRESTDEHLHPSDALVVMPWWASRTVRSRGITEGRDRS